MRNMIVAQQGGGMSRGGTSFVGFSKQTSLGRAQPPRLLPFQFSISQGIVIEAGNFYFRFIENGQFVTEAALTITGISQASPAVVTTAGARGASAATANTGGVVSSYAPGNLVTLAGGSYMLRAVLAVTNTKLLSVSPAAAGTGYAPGDTITVTGGTQSTPAQLTVATIGGGGAILTVTVTNAGVFTANPTGGFFTQNTTSGAGLSATFQFALMAPNALTVSVPGVYPSFPASPVAQASTTGTGVGATFTVTSVAVVPLVNGDWVVLSGINGMPEIDNQAYVVGNVTATTFTLFDVYGVAINSTAFTAYTSGGTAARIYTLVTPYADTDLEWVKYVQSKDVMSLCCLNQDSGSSYAPYDLARFANNNWTLTATTFGPTIQPPSGGSGVTSAAGTATYQYVITAVNPDDNTESVASSIIQIATAVNIAATAGTNTLTWSPVAGVQVYNVYKCTPAVDSAAVPVGAQFGYAGQSYGTQFIDTNIVPDFAQVPPKYTNPFAPGQITSARPTTGGGGYTSASVAVLTSTGSGAVLQAAIVAGAIQFILVINPGHGYLSTDRLQITGDGAGATATMTVSALTGTYPSVVSYLQQRRAYANTPNRPDTYFLSQPGAFTNFDVRIPTIDSDAITGNPWSMQVNGIQWIVNMPGGGLVFTGDDIQQLTGNGGSSLTPQPITPFTQQVQPQAYNGASPKVPPQKIENSVLYSQAKGSIWRDVSYKYLNNIYSGDDLTLNSPQLFEDFISLERAWCEVSHKVMWVVRDDGVMLSLTFVKAQEVAGWARHDTQGKFVSCCSVTELPVDALYVATQRFPAPFVKAFMIERMNDRLWEDTENAWCVDAGLFLFQPTPAAILWATSATGLGSISGSSGLVGGRDYSAGTVASIIDENVLGDGGGPGTGATASLTIVAGVITAVSIDTPGSGYLYPKLVISDPANSGADASARLTLNNATVFASSAAVFSAGDVGSVIRMGGGVAVITGFTSTTSVAANIISPIIDMVPNTTVVMEAPAGTWTMTAPTSTIYGLRHLAGSTVTGLYDGKVIPPTVVPSNGVITLPSPATQVLVGLNFVARLQTLYTDPPGTTQQAQRKKNSAVSARVQASGAFTVGANQPDGSVQNPIEVAPVWEGMLAARTHAVAPYNSTTTPLFTGDVRVPLTGGYDVKGQAAFEQTLPLPLTVLSCVSEILQGDIPETEAPKRRGQNRGSLSDG